MHETVELKDFLNAIGWTDALTKSLAQLTAQHGPRNVGRVIGQSKGHYQVLIAPDTAVKAVVAGRFHRAADTDGFPTVGDWVVLAPGADREEALIDFVLPRHSLIQRRRAGRRTERKVDMQLIAANVDHMLILSSMNQDFDLPRIARYVSLTRDTGCVAVVVLTKADLVADPRDFVDQAKAHLPGTEVLGITQTEQTSLAALERFFAKGQTTVLVGSSGVGKSSLTNYLLGREAQKTQGLSSESRGKHTTTTRDLRVTRFGGVVIDTPGMQEIADQTAAGEIDETFADVEQIELRCKFTDCQHGAVPGCAITKAIKAGQLDPERVNANQKAKRELAFRSKRSSR